MKYEKIIGQMTEEELSEFCSEAILNLRDELLYELLLKSLSKNQKFELISVLDKDIVL